MAKKEERKDQYIEDVIKAGDEGSALFAAACAPTLRNSKYVDIIGKKGNELPVLRIPEGYDVIVHSACGDPKKDDIIDHTISMVERLVRQAKRVNATPIAFSNVKDLGFANIKTFKEIASALVNTADYYNLAIPNGELAILGNRIRLNCDGNISGTMISIKPFDAFKDVVTARGVLLNYAKFDPKGKAVFINSDGVGTKTEFYERAVNYFGAIKDFFAMNLDDTIKFGADAKVISGVVETNKDFPFEGIRIYAKDLGASMKVIAIMEHEEVVTRLKGFRKDAITYNISGSVVSVIDEERLKNPLKPNIDDCVIAIREDPNPRSNGITDKRRIMIELFGKDWHKTKEGKLFLEYLAAPSTILYPVFKELVDEGLATSVYHMSGGAFNGKLARPLAKHNLFARLKNLFPPDWRELTLAGASFTSAEIAYSKWPMGNDGFITTNDPINSIGFIEKSGLEGRVVGRIEKVKNKTGVEIELANKKVIYYNGKPKKE